MSKLEKLSNEYRQLLHKMQAGVAALGASKEQTPKHLRVGINSALCDSAALVDLLIEKGVFTREEFQERLNSFVARDVRSYENQLSELHGRPIKLGTDIQ